MRSIRFASQKFCLRGGSLYYGDRRVILTEEEKVAVLTEAHAGQFGPRRTQEKITPRFYWRGITQDTLDWVRTCPDCQRFERAKTEAPELKPIKPVSPWHMVNPSLPISSLHLLVPPLQLISAAMWQVLQQQDVLHYGKLKEFVSLVMETLPELLSESQRTELTLGLQHFGSKTDTALEILLWEFLSRLDQLLPVPDLKQTVSLLGAAPSVLEVCMQSLSYLDDLKTLLRHHRRLGQLSMNATLSYGEEFKLPSMCCPPFQSVVGSTTLTDTKSQSESVTVHMNCSSPASSVEDIKTESVMDGLDHTGVDPRSSLNGCEDTDELTERKSGFLIRGDQKHILANMKEEEEEAGEMQNVKIEREDGGSDEEGRVTRQVTQMDRLMNNEVKSAHGQQEGPPSTLVTSCEMKRPLVLIRQLEIGSSSVPGSSPPRTMDCKIGQGARSPWRQREVSPLGGHGSLSQKGQVVSWKRKLPPSLSENGSAESGRRTRRRQRPRVHRPRTTYLSLSEEECRLQLRLPRQAVTDLCHLLADELETAAYCPYALPVAVKVTAALQFYAHGSFQHPLGSVGGISQSAVGSAIHSVTSALVRHANEFIRFPVTPAGREKAGREFAERFGFPGALGAVGCTHVQLRAPPENAPTYVNRKGTHSINIQAVCDAACRVTHVFANYPGSCRDSFILDRSVLPAVFSGDPPPDGWLLGDDGYPLRTWLMTPYAAPAAARELLFNERLEEARAVIGRTFGALKTRFRCLGKSGGTLQYSPRKVGAFFVACCVLHNVAVRHGCLTDLDEDALRDCRRHDAELRVPMPAGADAPAAAAQVRRDQLADELLHV